MKKEQTISNCVDEVLSGRVTMEECLRQHPELRDELQPLIEIALGIKAGGPALSSDSRRQIRSALVAAMAEGEERKRERSRPVFRPFTFRTAATVSGVLLAVAAAGSGTVYASQRSLPGDALYPVKTGSESIHLALTFASQSKANLHLTYAQRRVEELAAQAEMGKFPGGNADVRIAEQLDGALSEMANSDEDDVKDFMRHLSEASLHDQLTLNSLAASGSENSQQLQNAIGVLRRSKLIADAAYDNHAFLEARPSVTDEDLENGYFKISGTFTSAEDSTWQIDGMQLSNVNYAGQTPPANTWIKAEGLSTGGKVFVTSVTQEQMPAGQPTIEGKFNGTGEDGTVWYVGGIPVAVPESVSPPSEGDDLRLQRDAESDSSAFSHVQADDSELEGVDFEGTLSDVDINVGTITISKAGSAITVHTADANIRGEDRQTLTLSQLQSSIGKDVEARGLYRKDGQLRAGEIRVEYGERGEEGDD